MARDRVNRATPAGARSSGSYMDVQQARHLFLTRAPLVDTPEVLIDQH